MEADYESAFYAPAGYRDADLEMAALEDAGNRRYRRFKRLAVTWAEASALAARIESGETVTVECFNREKQEGYSVRVREVDRDEIGAILGFSVDGISWHTSARNAREGIGDVPEVS